MGDSPHYDDDFNWVDQSIMAQYAIKHLGQIVTSGGLKEFNFSSTFHKVLFYVLNVLPLLILVIGGSRIFDMSEKKLIEAINEHTKTNKS